VPIEIEIRTGHHDDIVPTTCRLSAHTVTTPVHYRSIRWCTGSYFVPPHQLPSVCVQEAVYPPQCIALQGVHTVYSGLRHSREAPGTCSPSRFINLLTTDMDIFGRKNSHHLCQYIVEKSKRGLITDTERM